MKLGDKLKRSVSVRRAAEERLRKALAFRRKRTYALRGTPKYAASRALLRQVYASTKLAVRKVEFAEKRLANFRAKLRRDRQVPGVVGGFHPGATRTQLAAPLGFVGAKPKLVWHTTEGYGLPVYSGSCPHFTLNPKTGELWQHVPITGGAYALENHAGGVETNRANAIQVELIGFARDTGVWPKSYYVNIARLARWIEKHAGVPRRCGVTFRASSSYKVRDWYGYAGHCGHQHVPENIHWDPGEFRIEEVI